MAIKPKYILNKEITANKQFTDRDTFLVAFNRALNREDLDENKILVYYGVGGIGKSSLINKICMNIDNDVDYAILDVSEGENKSVENALYNLRKSFNSKIKFPLFDLAYAAYWKKCHPNMVMNEQSFPYLDEGSVVLNIVSALGDFPAISILSSVISASDKISKTLKNYYLSVKNEVGSFENMSISELEEKLPYYWANDFNHNKSQSRKVIFIDTYESIWENDRTEGLFLKKDEWIRSLAEALPNVLFVICGREKLRWADENPEWEKYIEQHLIGALSDIDAKKFLRSSNITDEEIQEAIIDGSDGVPYYLDLAVDTYYSIKRENKECLPKYFAGTPKELFYRFIKHLTTAEIETLKVISIPRYFNFNLFSKLVKEFNTGYSVTNFYEFCQFSFITERNGSEVYEMHKLMRDSLIIYQNDNLTDKINRFMAELYEGKFQNAEMNKNKDLLSEYISEYYYHGIKAYHINDFVDRLKDKIESLKEAGNYNMIISVLENILTSPEEFNLTLNNLKYCTRNLIDSYMLVGKVREAEKYAIKIIKYLEDNECDKYDLTEFLENMISIDRSLYGVKKSIDTSKTLQEFLETNAGEFKNKTTYYNKKVNVLIDLGKLYVFIKDIDNAKNCYEEAENIIKHWIKDENCYESLGLINERLGEIYGEYLNDFVNANHCYTKSIDSFRRALENRSGDNHKLLLDMGLAYKRIGENNLRFNSIDESLIGLNNAIEIYDRVMEKCPEIVDAYTKKGFAYIDWLKVIGKEQSYRHMCEEFFVRGTEAFNRAKELNPYDRSIWTGLSGAYRFYGILMISEEKVEKAIELLLKAVEFGSNSLELIKDHPYSYESRAKSYVVLGDAYEKIGNEQKKRESYNNAIKDYEAILEITINNRNIDKEIEELKWKLITN